MKKRLFSILTTICMILCLVPTISTQAALTSPTSGTYSTLLNPNTDPGDAWRADDSNPYGTKKGQPFAITPFLEPVIYSYRNAKDTDARNESKVYTSLTLGKNIKESPSGTYSLTAVDNVAFSTGVAYDPTGTGRMDHAIFVGLCHMNNSEGTADVCYWIENLVTGKRSQIQVLPWKAPKWISNTEYHEYRHYFNVTAGDYDGDGKMTAVVTFAGKNDLWEIGGTGIPGEPGLTRNSIADSRDGQNAYFPSWSGTTTVEDDFYQVTKSLASADLDRDGRDELVICAGITNPNIHDDKLSLWEINSRSSKLSVYDKESGKFVMTVQKNLLSFNREDSNSKDKYYDHISYANIAAGDINCDGYDEIVIAGYYKEVKDVKDKGFTWPQNPADKDLAYAVFYGENNSITKVQKTSVCKYTAEGTSGLKVKPKPAMTCVAINGMGTAKQVFIAGSLYEVQQDGSLKELCYTARIKNNNSKYCWYQDVIAGNFDHNTAGREQVIALAAEKKNILLHPNIKAYDLFTDVYYGENFSGGSGTFSVAGKYSVTAENDEYSQLSHRTEFAWDMPHSCVLLAADVNKDGLFARYEGKGYGYSDAQIQAVLQAAPYFSELGDYDLDFSDGETTYTFSSGYSDTSSSSRNVSFGAAAVIQGDLKVWRYEATLGYTMDFTKSYEDTLSVEYSASFNAGGNDSVVLYRIPATTYYYSIYDPEKGDFDFSTKNIISLVIPGQPIYTMMDREYYDEFAVLYNTTYAKDIAEGNAKALPLLNSNVLPENCEGNPFAYWTNPGSVDPSVSSFESLSKQKYELGFGASSITNEWTTSTEHAEGVEISNGFSSSVKNTWGIDAANAGFQLEFSYSNATGKVYSTTKSSGASGTVNNIDRRSLCSSYGISYDVSGQYGFSWDFGMRTWSVGGQNIPVFGYVLSNLRAAPPIPTLTGISVTDNQSAKISWQAPEPDGRRPYTGYHVWVRIDDGEFERVTDTALTPGTLEYTYDSLQENTTYTFAISTAGYNGAVSALSNTKTFSTFTGTNGREVEFRNNGNTIQWRYSGEADSAYRDLVSLADLTGSDGSNGADGKQVELRAYGGYIQWKYTSDTVWNDLIALSSLRGIKGDKGDQGETGVAGPAGADGKDGTTPMLKIGDENYWYVSYDNGVTWTSLGVQATGSKGDAGEKGEKGDTGEKGEKGDTGEKGEKGDTGSDGKDGVGIADITLNDAGELVITLTDGTVKNLGRITGSDGKDGADGKNGIDGKNGLDGEDGSNGRDGKDGVGVAKVSVDNEGNITVTLTDGSSHSVGGFPITKAEAQTLKTTTGVTVGVAGISLIGLLSKVGYSLIKRKKLF